MYTKDRKKYGRLIVIYDNKHIRCLRDESSCVDFHYSANGELRCRIEHSMNPNEFYTRPIRRTWFMECGGIAERNHYDSHNGILYSQAVETIFDETELFNCIFFIH